MPLNPAPLVAHFLFFLVASVDFAVYKLDNFIIFILCI